MDCSICSLPFPSRGQPTCASCARALMYQARLERVTDLLANQSLRNTVNHVISPSPDFVSPSGPELVEIAESSKKHTHDLVLRETEASRLRCLAVDEQIQLLKQQMDVAVKDRETRRAELEGRRADMAKEKAELESRVPQLLDPLQTTIRRSQRRLEKIHARTVEGRIKLCQEMARLAGLQQRRRRMPDGEAMQEYTIGAMPIFDLRDLNAAHPHLVTASLANICRLLITCCHYLSIRLPAEITPPHMNYPHPTIFSLQSSYQGFQPPFPGTSTSSTSALDQRPQPKPRLLHLDRPLVVLAKEDPSRYNLFIEGVALLAWDIAWLCTSQGLDTGTSHQSICPLGKNLYTLFREHTRKSPSATEFPFGHLSHARVSAELLRVWRQASFPRFLDKMKQILLQDMSGAEWEVISDHDFDDERDDERAVLVGGTRGNRQVGQSVVSEIVEQTTDDKDKGYLKLKSRKE